MVWRGFWYGMAWRDTDFGIAWHGVDFLDMAWRGIDFLGMARAKTKKRHFQAWVLKQKKWSPSHNRARARVHARARHHTRKNELDPEQGKYDLN